MPDSLSVVDPTLQPELTIRLGDAMASSAADTLAPSSLPMQSLPMLSVDLRDALTDEAGATSAQRPDLEVRGVIGEGGMGRVLLARQHSLSRDVAVKTARREASRSNRDAILIEGTITGQLEHPAIVPVHALGLDPSGWPAMVMKRIEGVAWDGLLADPAHPGWEGWEGTPADRLPGHLQILTSVCNALHFAHSREVVHRDIKPANVLIGRFGDVYVADWGVATRIDGKRAQLCGTPAFMAPEMVSGEPVDARTDVYLLGSTLHAVLTGKPRHPGGTVTESLLHARASPSFEYGNDVPEELAQLANRACHADRSQRPETAKAFRDAISVYLRHRGARALGAQAIKRLTELEALHASPSPDDEQRRTLERLLLEARFGLEQALVQWPENTAAQVAFARVEAILEQRRVRSLALEREAKERDPARGAAFRTVGLAGMTLIALSTVIAASQFVGVPTPFALVVFPGATLAMICIGTWFSRARLLDTRFNREVFACLLISMGFILFGRIIGLFIEMPMHTHFVRDSFVTSAVMALCAVSMLRWTAIISVLFGVTGALCALFPAVSMWLFSGTTVITMALATVISWWVQRSLAAARGA